MGSRFCLFASSSTPKSFTSTFPVSLISFHFHFIYFLPIIPKTSLSLITNQFASSSLYTHPTSSCPLIPPTTSSSLSHPPPPPPPLFSPPTVSLNNIYLQVSQYFLYLFCLFINLTLQKNNTNRSLLFSLLKWVFNFPFPSIFFICFGYFFFPSVISSPFLFGACMHDSRSVLRILIIISWIPAGLVFLFFRSLFVKSFSFGVFFFLSERSVIC